MAPKKQPAKAKAAAKTPEPTPESPVDRIRNRISRFENLPAEILDANPLNWRTHPEAQRAAMAGALTELGWCGAVMVRSTGHGRYEVIDGHLRAEQPAGTMVPCLVLDVDEGEARKILASFDPIAAMAGMNGLNLMALMDDTTFENEPLSQMMTALMASIPADEAAAAALSAEGTVLAALSTDGYEPRNVVQLGETWSLSDRHFLMVADVFDSWPEAFALCQKVTPKPLYVPYGGPLVALTVTAKLRPMVIVQPVLFVASVTLDWWEDAHSTGSVVKL